MFWLIFVGFLHLFVALLPCLLLVNKILPFHLDEEKNYCLSYSEGVDSEVTDLASAWGHEGTRTNQGSDIIYITEKTDHQHQLNMCSAQILGY